jgi:hypothetical protein
VAKRPGFFITKAQRLEATKISLPSRIGVPPLFAARTVCLCAFESSWLAH